jgi:hypothetical protein
MTGTPDTRDSLGDGFTHWLYAPDRERQQLLAGGLMLLGLEVELADAADTKGGWLVRTGGTLADQERVMEVAAAFECEYDGWETGWIGLPGGTR